MAKEKVKAALPEGLKQAQIPTLQDPEGSRLHPLCVDLLRSRWDGAKLTFEGCSLQLMENGSGLMLTITSKTARLQTSIEVSSIVTMWDELEAKLAVNGLAWKANYDRLKKARREIDEVIK